MSQLVASRRLPSLKILVSSLWKQLSWILTYLFISLRLWRLAGTLKLALMMYRGSRTALALLSCSPQLYDDKLLGKSKVCCDIWILVQLYTMSAAFDYDDWEMVLRIKGWGSDH